MKTCEYVLELGVEEIPAQYIVTMADSMKASAEKFLSEVALSYDEIKVYYTPRRLAIAVKGLSDRQEDKLVQVKGPAKKIAFDESGEPTPALSGFLKKNGFSASLVKIVSDGKNEYVVGEVLVKGRAAREVLGECMEKVVAAIYNPNPMRWASYKMKFIRPIRWILSVCDEDVVPLELECASAGRETRGHRTLANESVVIKNAKDYLETLRKVFVIADRDERRKMIVDQIEKIERAEGFEVERDDDLLDEINNLVEYPTVAVGSFEEKYLKLPECVIKSPLKTQQRYFPVYKGGKITNAFVFVRNGDARFIENVVEGNERVLRPRLADAEFFWEKDEKTSLEDKAAALSEVVFVNKIGSYKDKSVRVEDLALKFAANVGFDGGEEIKTVARLMKADLVSNLVREYTEIQGLAGGEFAAREGYPASVCAAISEQYLPNFAGDALPSSDLSAITSIADKTDTAFSLCAAGLRPSGSGDPYGIRRQALGIFLIALDRGFDVDLEKFIDECAPAYERFLENGETLDRFKSFLKDFFLQRLKVFMREQMGYSKDELDVLSLDDLNIYKSVKKANIIRRIRGEQWYLDFLQIYNRVLKLLAAAGESAGVFSESVSDPAAKAMTAAFYARKEAVRSDVEREDYELAVKGIAECAGYINDFLAANQALCEDVALRRNRVAFFADFCALCSLIIKLD